MRVLVCAASGAEAKACAKGIADSGLQGEFEILETGVGPARAAESLEKRFASGSRPQLVVSSGFAGALSAELPLFCWVTSDEVSLFESGQTTASYKTVRLSADGTRVCKLMTSTSLVAKDQHQRFVESQEPSGSPLAVDMETAALARVCAGAKVAFGVFRMITDTPERPLPQFVSAIAATMAAHGLRSKISHGVSSAKCALRSPKEVAKLVVDSGQWLGQLRNGWAKNAPAVRNYCGNLRPE